MLAESRQPSGFSCPRSGSEGPRLLASEPAVEPALEMQAKSRPSRGPSDWQWLKVPAEAEKSHPPNDYARGPC